MTKKRPTRKDQYKMAFISAMLLLGQEAPDTFWDMPWAKSFTDAVNNLTDLEGEEHMGTAIERAVKHMAST